MKRPFCSLHGEAKIGAQDTFMPWLPNQAPRTPSCNKRRRWRDKIVTAHTLRDPQVLKHGSCYFLGRVAVLLGGYDMHQITSPLIPRAKRES